MSTVTISRPAAKAKPAKAKPAKAKPAKAKPAKAKPAKAKPAKAKPAKAKPAKAKPEPVMHAGRQIGTVTPANGGAGWVPRDLDGEDDGREYDNREAAVEFVQERYEEGRGDLLKTADNETLLRELSDRIDACRHDHPLDPTDALEGLPDGMREVAIGMADTEHLVATLEDRDDLPRYGVTLVHGDVAPVHPCLPELIANVGNDWGLHKSVERIQGYLDEIGCIVRYECHGEAVR